MSTAKDKTNELFFLPELICDVEVYPLLFHVTFTNPDDINHYLQLTWYPGIEVSPELNNAQINALKYILANPNCTLIGYNFKKYDIKILKFVASYNFDLPNIMGNIKAFSDLIINNQNWYHVYKNIPEVCYYNPYYKFGGAILDLMALNYLFKSLKAVGINLNAPNIIELPYPINHKFTSFEEIETLEEYCLNDCDITTRLYRYSLGEIKSRRSFAKYYPEHYTGEYNSMSRSTLAQLAVRKWFKEYNFNETVIQKIIEKVHSKGFYGRDFLFSNLYDFKTDACKDVYNRYSEFYFDIPDEKRATFKHAIELDRLHISFGEGGLHTKDKSMYAVTDDNMQVIAADVESYYPRLIIEYNLILPVLTAILKRFAEVVDIRLHAKKTGDSETNEAFKIIINAFSGLLGDPNSLVYYKKGHLSMTINGQLLLLQAAEDLILSGIRVLSINTDGIIFLVNKGDETYKTILNDWQEKTKAKLDIVACKLFAASATNNYMYTTEKGKTKAVGIFNPNPVITQSDNMPIIKKALYQYFVENKSVEETVLYHTNIHDFLLNQVVGKKFNAVLFDTAKNEVLQELGRVNRWYWSNESNCIIGKVENGEYKAKVPRSDNCKLMNRIEIIDPPAYSDLDYDRYINEINEYLIPILNNKIQ